MCGICGVVGPSTYSPSRGERTAMRDALAHRGPDEPGEADLSAGLPDGHSGWFGHRRLRIVDLSDAARQPMASDDGQVLLTYNGEVYNFRALRAELEARGARFRSTGDTEVVLRAYEEWGERFVERLDGMFALAIWDARRSQLVLARDRTGKKPLYYTERDGAIVFGSEIKSILHSGQVERAVATEHLGEFLTFGYVPYPDTLYEGISQLPPASIGTWRPGEDLRVSTYWDPLDNAGEAKLDDAFVQRVADLLREATERRMVADVPLGALLSGGIDSSLVVGLMSRASPDPIHTFSIGFPEEPSFDERSHARTVADHFGTHHTEFAVKLDAVSLLDRLVWQHDQPFADSSAVPTFVVSELARQHVTVVLNGDGGDEVFGGYDRFVAAALTEMLPSPLARAARPFTRLLPVNHGYYSYRRRAERFLELADAPLRERYLSWIAVAGPGMLPDLLASDPGPVTESLDVHYRRAAHLPALDQILYVNFKTYLPDDLAVKMDRMSMAHSLEARSPFLDTALIEHLARLPARRKVGMRRLKPVLRRAFGPLLPDEIWNRRKHGFGVPVGTWFRGGLAELFSDEVLAADARALEFVDRGCVESLWREHREGDRDHGFRFWTLLTLERWLRTLEEPLRVSPPSASGIQDAAASLA